MNGARTQIVASGAALAALLLVGGCPSGSNNGSNATGCVEWNQTAITSDTTIPAGCYLVNDVIAVSGGTLTLAPGVTLRFAAGTGVSIDQQGALHAAGTAASPILLTGQSSTRGYWGGVQFSNSNSVDNVLDYVTIEYGGQNNYTDDPADVTLYGNARLAISHTTLRQSANYGLVFSANAGAASVTAFDFNTLTQNNLGPVHAEAVHIGFLKSTSSYTGNDVDQVVVGGGLATSSDIDQTWAALGVDYRLDSELDVTMNHLTIAPGARLVFANGGEVWVDSAGALIAQGTAASPIVFTAVNKVPGAWLGIIVSGGSVGNSLQYATIEYGGQAGTDNPADLGIYDQAQVTVQHCTIQHSLHWGLWSRGATLNSDITTANTFADNAAGNTHISP